MRVPSKCIDSTGERATCTVAALAASAQLTWADAHAACALAGRKEGKGAYSHEVVKTAVELGLCKAKSIDYADIPRTVRSFTRQMTRGYYYVCVAHHALAVLDGVIYSNRRSEPDLAKIKRAWQIIPTPTKGN